MKTKILAIMALMLFFCSYAYAADLVQIGDISTEPKTVYKGEMFNVKAVISSQGDLFGVDRTVTIIDSGTGQELYPLSGSIDLLDGTQTYTVITTAIADTGTYFVEIELTTSADDVPTNNIKRISIAIQERNQPFQIPETNLFFVFGLLSAILFVLYRKR